MLWAKDPLTGKRIEATRGVTAICPLCGAEVRPKCGPIMPWHWAHTTGDSCDPWSESETAWHRWWKARAPVEWQEVPIGNHRADIRTERGVIELQCSPLDADEIREREAHYKDMIWVIDGRRMTLHSLQFEFPVARLEEHSGWCTAQDRNEGLRCWEWRWPRSSFTAAKKTICFDLCDKMLIARRVTKERTPRGWVTVVHGKVLDREQFLLKLGLTPPNEAEQARPLSYLVQFRRPGVRTVRDKWSGQEKTIPYSSEWREFQTLGHLERWRERHPPEEAEVFIWRGDGRLTSVEGELVPSTFDERR